MITMGHYEDLVHDKYIFSNNFIYLYIYLNLFYYNLISVILFSQLSPFVIWFFQRRTIRLKGLLQRVMVENRSIISRTTRDFNFNEKFTLANGKKSKLRYLPNLFNIKYLGN